MMNLYEGIQRRRSIRHYDKRPIEKEEIEKLLRAAMQAPSAANQRPWEFIVVENKETLQKLSNAHLYATPIKNASLGIIVLSREDGLIYPQYWQQDLAAATENILLEAVELGLGAVWKGVAPEEDRMAYIKELFQLPQGVKAFAMLAVGYSSDNKFEDRFDASRIHYEKY
jgi:nitroreductase